VSDNKKPVNAIVRQVFGLLSLIRIFPDISRILTAISDISLTAVKFPDISIIEMSGHPGSSVSHIHIHSTSVSAIYTSYSPRWLS